MDEITVEKDLGKDPEGEAIPKFLDRTEGKTAEEVIWEDKEVIFTQEEQDPVSVD